MIHRIGPVLAPGQQFEQTRKRITIGDAIYSQYQGSRRSGFGQEGFLCFPIKAYIKQVTPEGWPFFAQRHNLDIIGRCPLDDAPYQKSRL